MATLPTRTSPRQARSAKSLDLIGRAVQAAPGVPTTDKAKVVVTIDWDTLIGQLVGTGLSMTGDLLSPETVRRRDGRVNAA